MNFKRFISEKIEKSFFKGKIIILYGPRQSGKTTLMRDFVEKYKGSYFLCEEPDVAVSLTNKTSTEMWSFLGTSKLIILDEAQKIPNIGTTLKLLHDSNPHIQVIATGSSSFELANKINEPLTGRNWEFYLYPLSVSEIRVSMGKVDSQRLLPERLIYGSYPEIVRDSEFRERNLSKITNDYLYKDLLAYDGIRKSVVLRKLLELLAFHIGSQVSYNELAQTLSISRKTVISYIDLLEQSFVLFRLHPLSTNQRNEIKKMPKIYFYDNGIRNMIIQNMNPVELRNDVGQLFENYFISEKVKQQKYNETLSALYFWRTKDGQEIDVVESYRGGQEYVGYECKWSKLEVKPPARFLQLYANVTFNGVNRHNFFTWFS